MAAWRRPGAAATARTPSTSTTRASAHDNRHHKGCPGRWRGVVSLGFSVDGKRRRKKVSGKTKTEVRDKLKDLHADLDAGIRTPHGYTVEKAVTDWLADDLPGRTAKTIKTNHDALKPLLDGFGSARLAELTAHDVRSALTAMAARYSTRTLQKAHNCLTRVIRHAEAHDLVRRNVSALVDTPEGQPGRPSQSLTLEQATALLAASARSRLHAFIVLCLLTGVRSEEARALRWGQVDLDAGTLAVWRLLLPVSDWTDRPRSGGRRGRAGSSGSRVRGRSAG